MDRTEILRRHHLLGEPLPFDFYHVPPWEQNIRINVEMRDIKAAFDHPSAPSSHFRASLPSRRARRARRRG